MLESVLERILTSYFGEYIDGLEKNHLQVQSFRLNTVIWKNWFEIQVGLFSGEIRLSSLSLKPTALDELRLPVEVRSGFLQSLVIQVHRFSWVKTLCNHETLPPDSPVSMVNTCQNCSGWSLRFGCPERSVQFTRGFSRWKFAEAKKSTRDLFQRDGCSQRHWTLVASCRNPAHHAREADWCARSRGQIACRTVRPGSSFFLSTFEVDFFVTPFFAPSTPNTVISLRLIAQVVANLQVTILNVHVRYEDAITIPAHPFACGLTVAEMAMHATDARGKVGMCAPGKSTFKVGVLVSWEFTSSLQFFCRLSTSRAWLLTGILTSLSGRTLQF